MGVCAALHHSTDERKTKDSSGGVVFHNLLWRQTTFYWDWQRVVPLCLKRNGAIHPKAD